MVILFHFILIVFHFSSCISGKSLPIVSAKCPVVNLPPRCAADILSSILGLEHKYLANSSAGWLTQVNPSSENKERARVGERKRGGWCLAERIRYSGFPPEAFNSLVGQLV
ncbi:hypothetical protein An02g05940 [Aspergillus niger]|uniref:Uncharacterized protein n=2 Tax=Aspergillus niger TaxID=5061 RepID=A2QD60_ASPNC|nr:hypothetical protein An02g05940 [Aspergillus niger]CAK44209.1 hypothetical protein An02g05940 [Aspergillus niger]